MLLNRIEYALMNNPIRASMQRHFEARRLLRMGGRMHGGRALELGCGRGVGTELILDRFGADSVDAFDLDPRMAVLARRRLAPRGSRVRVWVGDATAICAPDATYEAVFDFGIVHHVPHWREALAEVHRVLKPGGLLYSEEVLRPFIVHPVIRRLLEHPLDDRFDSPGFAQELRNAGLEPFATRELWGSFAWFAARKGAAAQQDTAADRATARPNRPLVPSGSESGASGDHRRQTRQLSAQSGRQQNDPQGRIPPSAAQ